MNVKKAIQERRSIRSFDPVDITDELIKDLAESAKLTPSCMNKQPWKLIFIRNETQLQKIFSTLTPQNSWAKKSSLIIAVAGKPKDDCRLDGRLYYMYDIGMATSMILLRATELGLVTHIMAGFSEEKAKRILEIPEDLRLIALIAVGKRSKEVNPELSDLMKLGEKERPPRIPFKRFAYLDKYKEKIND